MKKRIVALLLVLVLTMAMMVPVFAAEPRADGCPHVWQEYYENTYTYANSIYHWVKTEFVRYCPLCAEQHRQVESGGTILGFHSPTTGYCNLCRHEIT